MKTLEFFLAYARIYGLMNCTFRQVRSAINSDMDIDYYIECHEGTMPEYIDDFLKQYNLIVEYGLLDEVCHTVQVNTKGVHVCTIWEAADEWDVLI